MSRFAALVVVISLVSFTACRKDPSVAKSYIALTFDDGPDSVYTVRILDILKEKNVKATFFVTGYHARRYPEVLKRIHREGHLIGNHTYSHLYFPTASDSVIDYEVDETQRLIDSITGVSNRLFRTPYGFINDRQKKNLEKKGYRVVQWDIDPLDYNLVRTPGPQDIADRVLLLRKNNQMVLLHSADYSDRESRENTVLALPRIIDGLRNRYNFGFITVDQVPLSQ